MASCTAWLRCGVFPNSLNDTIVVLIPKVDNSICLKDLRPISLCNVLYKIVSKVLANRLKKVLHNHFQYAFLPDRLITDNVTVAFEIIHSMRQKTKGTKFEAALKIDITKAYDRVDWLFLKHMLSKMGFGDQWIKWMWLYISIVNYNIALNGELVGPICPHRGLRQGIHFPLTCLLFVLKVCLPYSNRQS